MIQSENYPSNTNKKVLSAEELRGLLRNPSTEFLTESYGKISILIDGYTIEDEQLILDDSITLDLPLTFQGCTFTSGGLFFIDGITCNESLTFDSCEILCAMYFNSGIFKKEVLIRHVSVKSIRLYTCVFDKIKISGYDIGEVFVSGPKFRLLEIGEHPMSDSISKLVIFVKEDETGNILIREQAFSEISLLGTNNGKVRFEKIKCDNISITKFKNQGSLDFYGIEPKDIHSDKRYFQIINSNLEKVQFYRAFFSQYDELIIIDSFLTDSLFIGCSWSDNVRAIYGPGYQLFEKSLKTGRKANHEELVAIKEAYRQLKISMSKHSDKIQEHKFYALELNFHNEAMSWGKPWKNQFWDKAILLWSKVFSDYGQSFIKPLLWLLFGHYFFFTLALAFSGFYPLHISFLQPTALGFQEAFRTYLIYINPFRRLEISLPGYLILLDLLMRVWSSYMIYNLIRASRRFIS